MKFTPRRLVPAHAPRRRVTKAGLTISFERVRACTNVGFRRKLEALEPGEVRSGPDCLAVSTKLGTPGNPNDDGGEETVIVPRGVLHRDRTAAWVYPLVPITLALDAAATPLLVLLWTPYIAVSN